MNNYRSNVGALLRKKQERDNKERYESQLSKQILYEWVIGRGFSEHYDVLGITQRMIDEYWASDEK